MLEILLTISGGNLSINKLLTIPSAATQADSQMESPLQTFSVFWLIKNRGLTGTTRNAHVIET